MQVKDTRKPKNLKGAKRMLRQHLKGFRKRVEEELKALVQKHGSEVLKEVWAQRMLADIDMIKKALTGLSRKS